MASRSGVEAAPVRRRTLGRPLGWPWWVQVLVVHLAARGLSALVLVRVAATQAANPWTGAAPSYLEYAGLMWDASWYRTIAESGYPSDLPLGADGRVQQNAWAFYPLFPVLVRGVVGATGAPWQVTAPTFALVVGAAAMLVVHQVVAAAVGRPGPLPIATVAVLSTAVAAPVLQVGYTESLALLLLAAVLHCLQRRWYLPAIPLVVGLGLTRAVALPVTIVVIVHAVQRLRSDRQERVRSGAQGEGTADSGGTAGTGGTAGWPTSERVAVGVLALVAAGSGLLWPVVTGAATGVPDAYARTQGAWRGRGEVVLLLPWLDVGRWLLGGWGLPALLGVLALAAATVVSRPMRRLGAELQAWTIAYLAYLLVVVEPGTSLLRFLLLAFPLAAVVADAALRGRRPRAALALVILTGVVGQVWWVSQLWRLVPPSGWPP